MTSSSLSPSPTATTTPPPTSSTTTTPPPQHLHTSLKSLLSHFLQAHQDTLLNLISCMQKCTAKSVLMYPKQMKQLKEKQEALLGKLSYLQNEMNALIQWIVKHQKLSQEIYDLEMHIEELNQDTSQMVSLLGNIYHESFNIQRKLQQCHTTERNNLSYDELVKYAEKISYVISAPADFRDGETVLTQHKPPYPRPEEWMHSVLYDHKAKEYIQEEKTRMEQEKRGDVSTQQQKEVQQKASGMVDTMQMMTQKRLEMQQERMKMEQPATNAAASVTNAAAAAAQGVAAPSGGAAPMQKKPAEQKISLFGLDDSSDEDSDEDED